MILKYVKEMIYRILLYKISIKQAINKIQLKIKTKYLIK